MTPADAPDVLIVDDEPLMREIVGRILTGSGYALRFATSAEEAVAAVSEKAPAVIVSDVHMGGQSGLWLANQVQRLSPATAIVLATGDDEVPPGDSLGQGVVAYVLKPFRQPQVLAAVQAGVRWSEQQRANPRPAPRAAINPGDLR
jgi:two-component system nitrogen regulation response regulator NtrX